MHIRIGTRTSLMAMAQAKMVAAALTAKHPDVTCEFVGITPIGDRDKKTPLWQMGTVGVFSKEIDEQLLAGNVDITVHSFKDLGTQRPQGIVTGALLAREDPRDVALFRRDVFEKLQQGLDIFIGTSAPRRTELLPDFLTRALPNLGNKPRIHVVPLRGNANSRIARLKNPAPDDTPLDGIVLALAGLGRLWRDDAAYDELQRLLEGLMSMVLPLTVCPSAPGQGTVCVETLDKRQDMRDLLASINHAPTTSIIAAERKMLIAHGGGCHQKFGATCLQLPNIPDPVTIVCGKTKDNIDITELRWNQPNPTGVARLWNPMGQQNPLYTRTAMAATLPADTNACFVAHTHALPDGIIANGERQTVTLWASGTDSWEKLAARGYWVSGCADGFGFDFISRTTLAEPQLQLPPLSEWVVVTSNSAAPSWGESGVPHNRVIATYDQQPNITPQLLAGLKAADAVWWPSATAYEALKEYTHHIRTHCCGVGKTASALQERGITPIVFPNRQACEDWIAAQSGQPQNGTYGH